MLADITDPRDPRGVRHPLVAVLGVAVVATLAGAASYRELGSVAAGPPQELLPLLGARWDLAGVLSAEPASHGVDTYSAAVSSVISMEASPSAPPDVRFWERNGSGETRSGGLRCGDRDRT